MLACERWTLTQSSGWAAVLVGFALALLLGLLSGLTAMNASREAETVAAAELCDDDAEAEPAWDGEPVGDVGAEPVPDGEPVADVDADADADDGEPELGLGLGLGFALELDGGGDSDVLLDVLPDAGAVGEAEADVDEPEGDGDGDVVGLEVDGCGVGVLAVGSTSHLVAVLALAVLLVLAVVLVLAMVLVPAALAFTVPARAAPGQPASTPRARNPPASRLSTAARTCARRMNIALSTLLIEATVCSCGIRRRLGDGWV
jgi:pyruvate/2-oxoglutarate dehydrogenase complex dihydrolipoamide acyltransferase (E2) component